MKISKLPMQVVCHIGESLWLPDAATGLLARLYAAATDGLRQAPVCGVLGITAGKREAAAGEWNPCPQLLSTMWHPSIF